MLYKLDESKLYPVECDGCNLCVNNRFSPMQPVGNTGSVMIVGEAPNLTDKNNNSSFTGTDNRMLLDKLDVLNLTRYCYFTNAVKCNPPSSRTPMLNEITTCKNHLLHEIHVIQPRIIVLLGSTPTKSLLNIEFSTITRPEIISTDKGNFLIVTYSPKIVNRKKELLLDFNKSIESIGKLIKEFVNPLHIIP